MNLQIEQKSFEIHSFKKIQKKQSKLNFGWFFVPCNGLIS